MLDVAGLVETKITASNSFRYEYLIRSLLNQGEAKLDSFWSG